LIFTKFDAQDIKAYKVLKDEGYAPRNAQVEAPMRAAQDFEKSCSSLPIFKSQYPPKAFIILRGE
jgi:hypothetical protein